MPPEHLTRIPKLRQLNRIRATPANFIAAIRVVSEVPRISGDSILEAAHAGSISTRGLPSIRSHGMNPSLGAVETSVRSDT